MDQRLSPAPAPTRALPRWELIAMMAALMAINALAIDVMLPGLQQIGASLGVENENHRQLVITAYVAGLGIATLFFGPLSDRYGRRMPLMAGLMIYVVAAFAAAWSQSFEMLLVCRFVQGFGAASTRVISISIIRDVFGGRAMAEVMSLVFMVFMVVPVIAPSIGQVIILAGDWHMIFVMMGGLTLAVMAWAAIRLPETLDEANRRPLSLAAIGDGFRIVMTTRVPVFYTLALTVMFGSLFGFINSSQQIYQGIYGIGALFPLFFGAVAGLMALSSFVNSRLVGRFGMRRLSHGALLGFIAVNALAFGVSLMGPVPLWAFTLLFGLAMVQFSWIGANFNSLAMEPLGHVAGMASSVQSFIQTVFSGILGALIGQAFDGTTTPLAAGYFLCSITALGLVLIAEKGRLFRSINAPT
jgi:DHA1 family bicyclomycin/chloramphenicol resistance-like MFS transporter